MAIVIELKRSSVPGKVPTTTELALGELAINTYDGKLYLKKNVNGSETVVDISGGGGGGSGSFATSASFAATASFLLGSIANAISASYALSSSFATRASTANSATTAGSATTAESAGTAGFATSATSASYATTSSFSTTASFLLGSVTSASYALTASFTLNAGGSSNINTGSFATTGSNSFTGNQIIQSPNRLGLGSGNVSSKISITSDISGSTTAYGISVDSNLDVGVTTNAVSYRSFPIQTSGGPFTAVTHYLASTNTFLGTVINQYGFYADSSLNGATNNYGFYGNIASSGLSRYNIYMPGTAPNYLQGNTSIGKVSASTALDISGNTLITGSLTVTQPITGSLNGTASFATTASFALNAVGGSSINTGSFATTGSNNFNGNQTITGSLLISSSLATDLTVVGNSIFTGSATISIPDTFTEIPPTALTLRNEASSVGSKVPGTSIEFWSYNTDENSPSGIYKSSYIISNPYYNQGLTFGNFPGTFKFNSYNSLGYQYTGSVVTGSQPNPIGSTVFEINNSQVSSSVAILAPSFTGNLTGTASFASNVLSASYARTASIATTADAATTITTVNNTGDAIRYLVWAATGAGNRTPNITTQRFVVNSATGSMGINKSTIASGYNLDVSGSVLISGSLVVTSSVSASTLGQFTGNNNGFVEFSIRNTNNGVSASSDIAVYNNSGSALLNHIDMGINSSNIAAGYSFGRGNDSYIYNTGGDLFIGNNTAYYQPTVQSQSLYLFANSAGTPDLTITGSRIGIQKSGSLNATLDVSGSVIITGSVQGNVSALTISSNTASINLNLGNFFTLTLSGSTHFTATNVKPGQTVNILLTTNATNNSASFDSTIFRQPSGSAYTPTGVNGAKDILTLVSYDATNLYVASVKNLV
jgi:hypothetical protein